MPPAPPVSPVSHTLLVAVSWEVLAFVKFWRAVHQFELARLRPSVPEVVKPPPVSVLSVLTWVTVPPPPLPPMHEPFMAKQPPVRLIPLEPVEVAERLKRVKSMPPAKVEVPLP